MQRVEKVEQDVENLRRAIESQTDIVADLRARVLPTPVDIMFQADVKRQGSAGSPVVRRGRSVEV